MHCKDFSHPIPLGEPTLVAYLACGRTYTKAGLPTDQTCETAFQGEWIEYQENYPFNHVVAHYDRIPLQSKRL